MNSRFPGGPPPDWADELLRRAQALLKRAEEALARAGSAAREAAGDARSAAARWASRWASRWAAVWAAGVGRRLRRGLERVDGALEAPLARLRPPMERAAGALDRLWHRRGPAIRRAGARVGAGLKRLRPTGRQLAVVAALLLIAGWVVWERCGLAGCPDVDGLTSYQPGGASVLLDRNGEPFADLAPMEYEVVPLDSLPRYVADAFIAVEDRRFFEHGGVDWIRAVGALIADIRAGGLVEGSSTIPMQLSRTLFPDRIRREEKTFRRKLLEVRMAQEIESRFEKEEILELYLNHVYLGGGSYGIQAASRYYFGKDAPSLDLEEAALLAALPKAPRHYDPRRHPDAARSRRDLVLALMEAEELLSFREAQAARKRELGVAAEPDRDPDGDRLAPYFVQHVRRLLEEELGQTLYAEPLRITTTLDAEAQAAAEEELEAQLRRVERGAFGRLDAPSHDAADEPAPEGTAYLQGAVVVLDARTGDVRAWVGGRDYDHSRYDRARLARRQAGSAFKPFIYAAALESGLVPSQPIMDSPYRLARRGAPDWEPENYSGRFEGRMSMRDALVRSQNVPAVRLAAAVGATPVADLAARAGITGEVPASPVAALGVTAVSPLEMTTAYSSFARLGTRIAPRFVLRVEDGAGSVLWQSAPPEPAAVTSSGVAYLVTDMLRDVVDRGTATGVRRAGFYGAAAGKTGTTNDATDVWFVGYTPELVGTVWVGFDEVRPLPRAATGGGVAAPVWGRIMARVYGGRNTDEWWQPENVVALRVDPETGLALEDGCRPRFDAPRRELFIEGYEPVTVCPERSGRRFFDRLGGWFESVLRSRTPAPRIPGTTDPDLGVPRLPRRDGPTPDEDGDRDGPRQEWERRPQDRGRDARERSERSEGTLLERLRRESAAADAARERAEARRRRGGGG